MPDLIIEIQKLLSCIGISFIPVRLQVKSELNATEMAVEEELEFIYRAIQYTSYIFERNQDVSNLQELHKALSRLHAAMLLSQRMCSDP